ncbi:tetratricopeptide repeat protein, partial [Micromonospora chalcea]
NPAWGHLGNVYVIDVFDHATSVAFILGRTSWSDPASAGELAEVVEGLPLALEQAGAYMELQGTSISDYLSRYRDRSNELRRTHQRLRGYTAAGTWSMSVEAARRRSRAAVDMLSVASLLAPQDIPLGLLSLAVNRRFGLSLRGGSTSDTLGDAVTTLRAYSLVNRSDGTIAVHRLVQAMTRSEMSPRTYRAIARRTARSLVQVFPVNVESDACWVECERYLPHVLALVEHTEDHPTSDALLEIMNRAGHFLAARRRFAAVEQLMAIAMERASSRRRWRRRLVDAMDNRGHALRWLARYDEAIQMHEESRRLRARDGSLRPWVGDSFDGLGGDFYEAGEYDSALEAHTCALRVQLATHGRENLKVSHAYDGIGHALRGLGRFEEALEAYAEAKSIRIFLLGASSPPVAATRNAEGHALSGLGLYVDAEAAHREVLDIHKHYADPHDPRIAEACDGLGEALQGQGRHEEALVCHRHALEIYEVLYGEQHPRYAYSMSWIGIALAQTGNAVEAMEACRKALDGYVAAVGPTHLWIVACHEGLALSYAWQGDIKRVEYHQAAAAAILQRVQGASATGQIERLSQTLARIMRVGRD